MAFLNAILALAVAATAASPAPQQDTNDGQDLSTSPLTCPAGGSDPPIDPSHYTLPNDQPVVTLDASDAFGGLTERERLYAHYLSRASYYGSLIVLVQTSPEAPHIFRLLHRINTAQVTLVERQQSRIATKVYKSEIFLDCRIQPS